MRILGIYAATHDLKNTKPGNEHGRSVDEDQ